MTAIPFRGQNPVFPGPAPRPAPAPFPGAPGIGLGGYRPSRTLAMVGRGLLSPRNLRNFGVGGMVATLLADWVIQQANAYLVLWLNGLTVVRTCDPFKGMDGFTISTAPLQTCLTGTGGGFPLRQLGSMVATMDPTSFVRMLGLDVITPFGARFYKESKTYGIVPNVVGGARPRPFFGPRAWPIAPPRMGAIARPGEVPWSVRPWPVWGGPVPSGAGVTGGYAPPAVGGGTSAGDIPRDRQWSWAPPRPGVGNPPRAPAVPGVRAPAIPGMKETKVGANTAAGQMFFGLMRAREAVSEYKDFVETMFKALPKATQKRYGDDIGSMGLAVWENWDDFDFKLWFRNLLANQIEDEIIGRSYMSMRGATRNAVFGKNMGSLGPVNGPGFEDFAKAVSGAANDAVNPFFGYGSRAEHYKDRANRLARDRARKEARRREVANRGLR